MMKLHDPEDSDPHFSMLMTSDHTAGLRVTLCAERSLLAVIRTPQQQTQFQTATHDTTVHNLAHTRQHFMFLMFSIKISVIHSTAMLVKVSDKSCWGQSTSGLGLNKRLLRAGQRHVYLKTEQDGGYRCIYSVLRHTQHSYSPR